MSRRRCRRRVGSLRRVGAHVLVCLVLACLVFGAVAAPAATASTADAIGATAPSATAPTATAPTATAATADDHASVERDGQTIVVAVPADRVDGDGTVELTVEVPDAVAGDGSAGSQPSDGGADGGDVNGGANGDAEAGNATASPNRAVVTATRSGDRYVADVPVPDLVGPAVTADLSSATVRASAGGAVVVEDEADLRYLARSGSDGFDDATLTVAVDARGLGTDAATLPLDDGGQLAATIDGVGPNASLRVSATELDDLSLDATYGATVETAGSRVPGPSLSLSVGDAVRAATALGYRDGESVLVLPALHPDVGPDPVSVRVRTGDPAAEYVFQASDERGYREAPTGLVTARDRRITVTGGGQTVFSGHELTSPARDDLAFVLDAGGLNATDPAALEPYDAVLVHSIGAGVVRVPIDERLRSGESSPLPPALGTVSEADTALVVGSDVRPATATLERAPEREPATAPVETDPNADEFVAIWIDVADGAALLILAMVGSVAAVGAVFAVRLVRPAGSSRPGLRGAALHFVLGGVAGTAAITAVQRAWLGTLLDPVAAGGVEVGLGALLVGVFYGGLVASAIRSSLGTSGLWPTRYGAGGPTVPVRVSLTDDGGGAIPGEQTVEVQRPGTGRVLRTATIGGTATELELTPGDYGFVGKTGERETDPKSVRLPEPERTVPETRDVHLTVARPGLQVEVADAQTGAPIDGASVTVTTDRDSTKTETATEGSARLALPIETGTVTVVVDAEGYEQTTVEESIDQQLLTLDVDVPPATGRLVATALVDGEPLPGGRLRVAPKHEEQQSSIGQRTAALETDDEGRAETDLPAGTYGVRLELHGPTAHCYETQPAGVAIAADERAETTVHAQFGWEPSAEVRERADGLRDTIRSVAVQATSDPTIPLYFAGVASALLAVVDDLPDAGHRFATATIEPDPVAAVAVDAAQATLSGVGTAMQSDAVQRVLAAGGDPVHVEPDVDASPESLLAYLTESDDLGTVEARAQRVRERIEAEESQLATVAPARAIVAVALDLQDGADAPIQVAGRQYAALRLLDAVEECFEREEIRGRMGGDTGE